MKVLVTGANGFVGVAVQRALEARGVAQRLAVRSPAPAPSGDTVVVGSIHEATDWSRALDGVTAVIHLAARVHVMREAAADPLAAFRRVNTAGTEQLARAAVTAGVKRFVYVSSIKVNGEATGARPFAASDKVDPSDPYGRSKWEAECALRAIAEETALEVVTVRPTLVYGPRVRGNFLRLLQLVRSGLPLPFGAAANRRSLVYVENLASALVAVAEHPAAAGHIFLASDGEDLSTAELCTRLARSLHRPARLFPVPLAVLRSVAALARRTPEYQRLFGSLQVDASPLRDVLGWTPPCSVDQGLAATADWFGTR